MVKQLTTAQDCVEFCSVSAGISDLYASNWLRIDTRSKEDVGDLFVEDGVLVYGELKWNGREAISAFYKSYHASNESKRRTTRHMSINPSITRLGDDEYLVRSTVFVFSGIGPLPIELGPPTAVGDTEDICVKDRWNVWRFRRRVTTIVFKNDGTFDFHRG